MISIDKVDKFFISAIGLIIFCTGFGISYAVKQQRKFWDAENHCEMTLGGIYYKQLCLNKNSVLKDYRNGTTNTTP